MTIDVRAEAFARAAHGAIGQKRRYTATAAALPYTVHLADVVAILVRAGEVDPEALAVAWLHDTVEDTPITLPEIYAEFGERIAFGVYSLTNVFTKEAFPVLNRRERKRLEALRLAGIPAYARRVKYADLLSNSLAAVYAGDAEFGAVYAEEKRGLLAVWPEPEDAVEAELRAVAVEAYKATSSKGEI